VNVAVLIPQGSKIEPSPQDAPAEVKPPSGGPAVQLLLDENPSGSSLSALLIDAETGAVLRDEVRPEDREAFQQVLQTLVVAAIDPATAPWPYNGDPPAAALERLGSIAFIRPVPASGIQGYYGVSDSFDSSTTGGSQEYLRITNGRSTAIVKLTTAERATANEKISQGDALAFVRYIASIRVCGRDITC